MTPQAPRAMTLHSADELLQLLRVKRRLLFEACQAVRHALEGNAIGWSGAAIAVEQYFAVDIEFSIESLEQQQKISDNANPVSDVVKMTARLIQASETVDQIQQQYDALLASLESGELPETVKNLWQSLAVPELKAKLDRAIQEREYIQQFLEQHGGGNQE